MLFIQRVTRRLVSHLSLGLETPLFLRFGYLDSLWLPLETFFFSFFFNLFTVVNTPYEFLIEFLILPLMNKHIQGN